MRAAAKLLAVDQRLGGVGIVGVAFNWSEAWADFDRYGGRKRLSASSAASASAANHSNPRAPRSLSNSRFIIF